MDLAARFDAAKSASTLLVLFVPSCDRDEEPVDQDEWVGEALRVLGTCFGGATAHPQGRGVWRDDARGGALVYDEPVVIQCYTRGELIERHADELRAFLVRMGTATRQGRWGWWSTTTTWNSPSRSGVTNRGNRMADNIDAIARKLGAKVVARVPNSGGAFGAARLARVVAALQARLVPGQGKRPGRPSDPSWVHVPKVPMSAATMARLTELAGRAGEEGRRVSPMQLAAQLLEDAVAQLAVTPAGAPEGRAWPADSSAAPA